MEKNTPVFFAYVAPLSFSGQSAASELIIDQLLERGWDCRRIPVYPLDRSISRSRRYTQFIVGLLRTWFGFGRLLFRRRICLHLNLGQSWGSFARLGLPYFVVRLLRPDMRVAVSLHGSIFLRWQKGALITRVFRLYLKTARVITVLGENQKRKLTELGILPVNVQIVPNTCELRVLEETEVIGKHAEDESRPVHLLHISLLIESKGYPEYLEALELLANRPLKRRLEAVLCGPMSFTTYCTRFTDTASKEKWIVEKVNSINNSKNSGVRVQWIRGARGKSKRKLFENAEIFVLPTRFPVEAQPLVLLEALASGCAIIASTAGEIPSTLNDRCASLLNQVSSAEIAGEIDRLSSDPAQRRAMALEGLSLVRGSFSKKAYTDNWERIFCELLAHGKTRTVSILNGRNK